MAGKWKQVSQCKNCGKIYPDYDPFVCEKCGISLDLLSRERFIARRRLFGWEKKETRIEPINKSLELKIKNINKLELIIESLKNCDSGEGCKKCPVTEYCDMFVQVINGFGIGLNGKPVLKSKAENG